MNYFTRIKKSLLLVLISLFVQSCDKTCIKSNDFGEQSNVDLFKISAKDLSECVFDESSKDSSYSKMPAGGMLKKCMEGYKYDEDKNEYSTEPVDTVAVLIGYGYLDLGNTSDVFNTFKSKLEKDANKTLRETFEGYFCKDFDYLSDNNSNFITSFSDKSDVIANEDLIELNKRIYQECGNYCSNVCSGSLSTNNTSFDAATFSQLSWPHSTLKSSSSYYGINFKTTSNFKITATGSIQTSGIGTNIDANNSSIVINKNPYLPSYNLNSSSIWKATDKLNLFAKIEMLKTSSTDDNGELFSKFYLDFVDLSNTKLQSKYVPIECDNASVNMPNYVQKGENGNEYKGSLVFAEPKYSSVYCNYDNIKNICTFKADYAKLLTETGCLTRVEALSNDDQFNNSIGVEPFNDMQKNYYKYAVNDLKGISENDKQFVLSKSEEDTTEFNIAENNKTTLKYYKYTYEDNDGEFVLFTGTDEDKLKLRMALRKENKKEEKENNFLFDIKPYSYQKEILERLDAERKLFNKNKNLVIAATGVGKTVISAFDYKNYCKENKGQVNRLLFVVHREEILKQARDTFRAILKNNNFGELMVGGRTPENIDHFYFCS